MPLIYLLQNSFIMQLILLVELNIPTLTTQQDILLTVIFLELKLGNTGVKFRIAQQRLEPITEILKKTIQFFQNTTHLVFTLELFLSAVPLADENL